MKFNTLREKIAAEKVEREARYQEFSAWLTQAHEAGIKSTQSFEQESNVVNGHVWVIVRPGNSSFAQYAKKHGWKRANSGGIILWIDEFEESMIKKFEYAKAFALTLNSHGITAFADERMAP